MVENEVPFWEKIYQKNDITAFSPEPNKTVKDFEHLIDKRACILEAGCGEGQNVLYLAKQGYCNIDAFDISEAGISKLKKYCEISGVNINASVQDLTNYRFNKKYDLIMSFATLCFVEKDSWKRFIYNSKENTNIGGIHIIHIFTDTVPASADIASFAVGLAYDGEIKELYSDWKILQYLSYTFEDEHPDVPRHLHSVNKIVARKEFDIL